MTQELITEIPLDQLHDSRLQPRTVYRDIEGLAANIKAVGGIHSPLLVRPILPNQLRDDIVDGFEVVFGHRRLRAAELAGLATAPCRVRAMTDSEVRAAQMSENIQRDNMVALDEGAGFRAQIDAGDVTADELALQLGKSRSYVYSRMKLLALCGTVREGLLAGAVDTEVALLIARLRTEKLQAKALQAIHGRNQRIEDGGQESYRRIKSLLAEEFTLPFKAAIFPLNDLSLLPDAGACDACPKRAGNAPEFEDLAHHKPTNGYGFQGGADVCTDPDCWAAKKAAHLAREATKLRGAGQEVVDGNKARAAIGAQGDVKGAYVAADKIKAALKQLPKDGVINGVSVPKPVLIQNQRDGKVVKAYRIDDLVGAGVMKRADTPKAKTSGADQSAKHEAQRKADEQRAKAKMAQNMALLQHVRQVAATRERDAFDLRLVAHATLAGVPWNDKTTICTLWGHDSIDKMTRRVDNMSATELAALLMDCAIVDGVRVQTYNVDSNRPGPLLALAHHYGVNVKAVMATTVEPTSTPSSAGAGAKKREPAAAKKKAPGAKRPAVKYFDAATGQSWSGKGLRPRWINAAIARGKSLADFETKARAKEVMVDAGSAGERTAAADLFEQAGA